MNQENLLTLSIKDFFSSKMLKFTLMPFIISMIIMYALFFVFASAGLDALGTLDVQSSQTTIENGIPHTDTLAAQLEGTAIIQFLMSHAITSWIASFLVYAIGGFFTLFLSIIVAVVVIGFLTPYILQELQQRHYPEVELIGHSNIFSALLLLLKWVLVMLLLFILFVPLYFIPLLNIIAFNFPLYYFFHKAMTYDIASTICTKEEAHMIKFRSGNEIRLKTLGLYLLSLVPFAILFGAVFYVIYLGNTYFVELKKIRSEAVAVN